MPPRLLALSDLHVGHRQNRELLSALPAEPEAWLILAGDLGERVEHLRWVLELLAPRFARLVWVPGNHELWTSESDPCQLRGHERYLHLVEVCREYGVITPEDPYVSWPTAAGPYLLVPMHLLYDYSFAPDGMAPERALAWAMEERLLCTDEHYLHPDPYPSKAAWCAARVQQTEARLAQAPRNRRWILINHFPLHRELAFLPRIPRFKIWCGTRATEAWHLRYPVEVMVSGHLHIPSTRWLDGVRCEEVSLGYPRERRASKVAAECVREILPGAHAVPGQSRWWR